MCLDLLLHKYMEIFICNPVNSVVTYTSYPQQASAKFICSPAMRASAIGELTIVNSLIKNKILSVIKNIRLI